MSDLIGEEKEFDEDFWNGDFFKETCSDDEYNACSEKEDKYDDDFFSQEVSEENPQEPHPEKKAKTEKPEKKKLKSQQKKKKLKFGKIPGLTQKEMLEQAAIIEMYNTHDLKKLMSLEENNKVNLVLRKQKINATWRYIESNRHGKRKVTIWHTEPLESFSSGKPKKKICAVTGQIARYTDPLTGLCYCNKEAFKKIRDDYYAAREKQIHSHIKALEDQLFDYN